MFEREFQRRERVVEAQNAKQAFRVPRCLQDSEDIRRRAESDVPDDKLTVVRRRAFGQTKLPNVKRFGQTPLHFTAAHHGPVGDEDRARFAAMLIDRGARLDIRDDLLKSTPLGWACRWGRMKLAQLLIARGAPVHEPDAEPWATPQAWAEKMNHEAILAALRGMK